MTFGHSRVLIKVSLVIGLLLVLLLCLRLEGSFHVLCDMFLPLDFLQNLRSLNK